MEHLRNVYAHKAISQIPRILSLMDRNFFSPTYGCFHREYWLNKTIDFPDAIRQYGVQSLALVYKYDFPGNIYKGKREIRDWTIAGLKFWTKIQHKEGSFDEFYPYERGWSGPTAFTTFASIEAFNMLKDEIDEETTDEILRVIRQAAYFISKGDSEQDLLANHHAMACLAVWKAYELLGDEKLKAGFVYLWNNFLKFHNSKEGWSLEYDGVDPGYLSATVSFLSKIYVANPLPEIFDVLKQSIEFCSYFVYPNNFYAGSMGSRNTLHFYPHGFELLAENIPLARSIAEKMLEAISEEKLVPPEIISDRYVFYRIPEYLQSYLDYNKNSSKTVLLPYEKKPFFKYFPDAKIFINKQSEYYIISNLAKGGIVKIFFLKDSNLILNDCGLIGQLTDGRIVTSQWIDKEYKSEADEKGFSVSGNMNYIPSFKYFTLFKNLIFRVTLLLLGWNPAFAHFLKGRIRKALTLGRRPVSASFKRSLSLKDKIILTDTIELDKKIQFKSFSIGDEFFVRFVPQSQYFQNQELNINRHLLDSQQINAFNKSKKIIIKQEIISSDKTKLHISTL